MVDKRNCEDGTTSAIVKGHELSYGKDTYVVCDGGSSAELCKTTSAIVKGHELSYGKDTYVVCDGGSSAELCNKYSGFTFPSNYQTLQNKSALWG